VNQVKSGAPLRFLVVGAVNTLIGLFVIYICKWFFGLGDVTANVVGYITALTNSFYLNRAWTFGSSTPVLPALARFMVIFVLAYLVNLVTVLAAIEFMGLNSYLAQAIGIAPYTTFFYFGSRYFAFKAQKV